MILAFLAIITATPVTLPAALVAALPGDRIVLAPGDYPTITIKGRSFTPAILIDARRAKVAGGDIEDSGGVTWLGGDVQARGGLDGFAAAGYAFRLASADRVTIQNARISHAKKAIALFGSSNIIIRNNIFHTIREDGVIAASTRNLTITGNRMTGWVPSPRTCTVGGVVEEEWNPLPIATATANCEARDGKYADASHPDGVQVWNGSKNVLVSRNFISGRLQPINDFSGPTRLPVENMRVEWNTVESGTAHGISLNKCKGCRITSNTVTTLRPPGSADPQRTPIRYVDGDTFACGNTVDAFSAGVERRGMGPC